MFISPEYTLSHGQNNILGTELGQNVPGRQTWTDFTISVGTKSQMFVYQHNVFRDEHVQ